MPQGGVLTVALEQDFNHAILRIKDTGVGIPQENLSKVFSPFFTTKEMGSGLGLAEVQKVIQAHHGWIEMQSQEGVGTVFIIKIPFNP